MLDTTWRSLVSVDVRYNHYAYYLVGVVRKDGRYYVSQKHGRIGNRYPTDEGFEGIKVPKKGEGFSSVQEALEHLERLYRATLRNTERPYRKLTKSEELIEHDRRVMLSIKEVQRTQSVVSFL